jgi:dTDP-4-dehydrorhamnose reductase
MEHRLSGFQFPILYCDSRQKDSAFLRNGTVRRNRFTVGGGATLNIVVVGRSGQIAWELQRLLKGLGPVTAIGRPEIDLTNPGSVRPAIRELKPGVLVNAAAYTAVDRAEAEPELAMAVNAEAPRVMAEEAKRLNALFVTYSTDYVFDGRKTSPYTESDVTNPLSVYGASKLAGDRAIEAVGGAHLIFRTSWVYGPRGKNFLLSMMKAAAERDQLRVVDDQIGAPTSSRDIAQATLQIIQRVVDGDGGAHRLGERRGIYNMTSQGSVSWYGFTATIIEEMRRRGLNQGHLAKVAPIPTSEYPTAATRPENSRLSGEKMSQTFGVKLPDWKTSLLTVMEEIVNCGRLATN